MGRRWDGTEYLRKHQLLPSQIHDVPDATLSLVVTIPAHDEPHPLDTLASLAACKRPAEAVEIIVGINLPEDAPASVRSRHGEQLAAARTFAAEHSGPGYRVHVLDYPALPKRDAGVGLARKLIMDEAVARLCVVGRPEGIIACLDADCRVAPDYLTGLLAHFRAHPNTPACSIYYEHPLAATRGDTVLAAGIVGYELYLRYYVHALRLTGYPHAFQTVGSSMAVRCDAYQRVGGMNRRQGGEDFYFLSKLMNLGEYSELTGATVYPSPRVSHRVPFGTGRAMGEWVQNPVGARLVYPLSAFDCLRTLCTRVSRLWEHPPGLAREIDWLCPELGQYLDTCGFQERHAEIRKNAGSPPMFQKRFFQWFNGFRIVKFLNWARERGQSQEPIEAAATELLRRARLLDTSASPNAETLLKQYRELDRAGRRLDFG